VLCTRMYGSPCAPPSLRGNARAWAKSFFCACAGIRTAVGFARVPMRCDGLCLPKVCGGGTGTSHAMGSTAACPHPSPRCPGSLPCTCAGPPSRGRNARLTHRMVASAQSVVYCSVRMRSGAAGILTETHSRGHFRLWIQRSSCSSCAPPACCPAVQCPAFGPKQRAPVQTARFEPLQRQHALNHLCNDRAHVSVRAPGSSFRRIVRCAAVDLRAEPLWTALVRSVAVGTLRAIDSKGPCRHSTARWGESRRLRRRLR
jgi:hypothetical protein